MVTQTLGRTGAARNSARSPARDALPREALSDALRAHADVESFGVRVALRLPAFATAPTLKLLDYEP